MAMLFSGYVNADKIYDYGQVLESGHFSTKKTEEVLLDSELDASKRGVCSSLSTFAKSAVMARQNGVSADKMFSVIETDDPRIRKAMQLIIVDTFKTPILSKGKHLEGYAAEQANQFFIECMS